MFSTLVSYDLGKLQARESVRIGSRVIWSSYSYSVEMNDIYRVYEEVHVKGRPAKDAYEVMKGMGFTGNLIGSRRNEGQL